MLGMPDVSGGVGEAPLAALVDGLVAELDLEDLSSLELPDELQKQPGLLPASRRPGRGRIGRDAAIRARMHQRLYRSREETVHDKEILFDAES